MERISDKEVERTLRHIGISRDLGVTECAISPDDLEKIMQEIKDRRVADNKPLDIKAQLRLVRGRCPDVWERFTERTCPHRYDLSDFWDKKNNRCTKGIHCLRDTYLEECWDKALEGDQ